jgi:hypothetical protein
MDLDVDVLNVLITTQVMSCLFKSLINFTLKKFEKLVQLMILSIIRHTRSTKEPHHIYG